MRRRCTVMEKRTRKVRLQELLEAVDRLSQAHIRRDMTNCHIGPYGRISTEEVVLHLLLTKCVPILLYGLEACSIRKTDLDSIDFVVNRFSMKLFHTNNIDTVKECQMFFCFEMPSTLLKKRVEKFQKQCQNHQNTVCQIVNNFKP